MATRLRRLKLARVSLVDLPANEQARVVLFKSAVEKAPLEGESRGELKDSDFAAVWTDAEGRKQRKLPIHDAAHVRNALARWNQTDLPAGVKAKARTRLEAAARKFGIGEYAEKMQPTAEEVSVDEMARCKKCDTAMEKQDKGMKCPKCGFEMEMESEEMEKTAEGRPEEDDVDEKLKADLDAALAEVESLKKERDDLAARLDTPEEVEKRKLAALPESIRKQLEDQATEIRKMRDERAEAELVEKARKEMPNLPGKAEEIGRLMKRVRDVVSAEDFDALVTALRAASAQIEKGKLFREVGRPGEPEGEESPAAQVARMASEIVSKASGTTLPDAYAQIFRDHPELYAAYTRSVSANANADRD